MKKMKLLIIALTLLGMTSVGWADNYSKLRCGVVHTDENGNQIPCDGYPPDVLVADKIRFKLEFLIKDSEYNPDWTKVKCLEGHEHLFISLSEQDWNTITNSEKGYKRASFLATYCIKCRLIITSYCGNDWFRYQMIVTDK